jgi:hypothetical protein
MHWGFGSLFKNSLMHCLAERRAPPPPKKKNIIFFLNYFSFICDFLLSLNALLGLPRL